MANYVIDENFANTWLTYGTNLPVELINRFAFIQEYYSEIDEMMMLIDNIISSPKFFSVDRPDYINKFNKFMINKFLYNGRAFALLNRFNRSILYEGYSLERQSQALCIAIKESFINYQERIEVPVIDRNKIYIMRKKRKNKLMNKIDCDTISSPLHSFEINRTISINIIDQILWKMYRTTNLSIYPTICINHQYVYEYAYPYISNICLDIDSKLGNYQSTELFSVKKYLSTSDIHTQCCSILVTLFSLSGCISLTRVIYECFHDKSKFVPVTDP